MGTKTLSLAGIAVGTLALILALVALLTTGPEEADGAKQEVAALKTELGELKDDLARMSSDSNEASMKLAKLSGRTAALEREVAAAPKRGAEEPAAPAEVDEEKQRELVGELVRDEMQRGMREMMERFRGGMAGRRGRGTTPEALREELGLDAEKAEQIAQLHQKMGEGIRNIWRENTGGDREKNVELMNELRRKIEEETAKLLTPEQLEKYKEMQERGRGGRRRGPRGGRRGEGEREEGLQAPRGNAPVF